MTPFEIGIGSVILIVVMIYAGLYIPVALGLVSFLGVWIIRDDIEIAINMLALRRPIPCRTRFLPQCRYSP